MKVQQVKLIGGIVLSLLMLVVVLQNRDPVEIRLLFSEATMPLALMLFVMFVLGFVVGLIVSLRSGSRTPAAKK